VRELRRGPDDLEPLTPEQQAALDESVDV
jgi:hypothetical protein